MLISSNTILAC
uniref:Uncharacterized protein n=1 Tax=Arundo donax TaxID=35708 RepID=A0A0A9GT78_ARUDO